MKAYLLDPMTWAGMQAGYNRPLDRHDFPHGHIPDRVGMGIPGSGELRRFANLSAVSGSSVVAVDTFSFGTSQLHPLGSMAIAKDGRVYRYCTPGAAALVPGSIYQGAAPIALHLALTAVAESIGAGSAGDPITVTPGATAGAANLYAEGMLCISDGTGVGYAYRISGHAAITASVAFNLFLDPDDRINVALDTTSRYGLHHNPYKNIIVAATTVTAQVAGGAVSLIPANTTSQNYGWLQTRGPFPALINGTPGVGIGVVTSATTAGAVDVGTVGAEINVRQIGRMMQVGVSTKNNMIYLFVD